MRRRVPPLIWFLLGAFAAAGIGAAATASGVRTWYPMLRKPTWTPPNAVFGPVWTFLYAAMAVAAWRVWRKTSRGDDALAIARLYAFQLLLNAAWSVFFFTLHRTGLALADLVLLWIVLVSMLVVFTRADRIAGALWLAYVGWVSFAGALNLAIWSLNA